MKHSEKDKIKELLEIIQPSPMLRIGHFSDNGFVLSDVIKDFCQYSDYEYVLNCTDNSYHSESEERYKNLQNVKLTYFDLSRPNYLQHGKFYEYLFVSSEIKKVNIDIFLKKSHKSIKNAGLIIVLLQKSMRTDLDLWIELLEKNYFVATNTIDLLSDYEIIISKKMHGWGG